MYTAAGRVAKGSTISNPIRWRRIALEGMKRKRRKSAIAEGTVGGRVRVVSIKVCVVSGGAQHRVGLQTNAVLRTAAN